MSLCSVNGWSLWLDESSTAFLATEPNIKSFIETFLVWHGSESQMPGFVFSVFIWEKIFGHSEYALRSFNFLLVVIMLIYLLTLDVRKKIERSDKVKIKLFVLFSFISPFVLYNMNEARGNIAIFVFGAICLASLTAYLKYGVKKDWIICLLSLVIGFSFNLLFVVIVCPLLIIAIAYNKNFLIEHWKAIVVTFTIMFCIGLYYMHTLLSGSGGMKEKPGIINIIYSFYEFLGFGGVCIPKNEIRTGGDIISKIKPFIIPSALLILSYCSIFGAYIKVKVNYKPLLLFVSSLLAFFVIAFFSGFRFWGRHMLMLYPLYIYMVSDAVFYVWKYRKIRWCVIYFIATFLFASIRVIIMDCYKKENIKEAIEYCNYYNTNNLPIYYHGFPKLADYYKLNNYVDCCLKDNNINYKTEGLMLYHNSMQVYYTNGQYKGVNPLFEKDKFQTEVIWEDKDSKLLRFKPISK